MGPTTQYASSDGCAIAYQVVGEGSVDVLFIPGLLSHLDLQWGDPQFAAFLSKLASHARLIIMDQRGVGLSDATDSIAPVETRAADVAAVAAAACAHRPIVIGHCHGGPVAITYAAAYPERVGGLILMSTFARGVPDGRAGALTEESLAIWTSAVEHWGQGHSLSLFLPSRHEGTLYRRGYAAFERAAMRPAMARAAVACTRDIDVTAALEQVRAPTLVIHCDQDFIPPSSAEHLAARIPGARLALLPGADHVPFAGANARGVTEAVLEFVGGSGAQLVDQERTRFGAVLMTDIVNSTGTAARLGDTDWAATLMAHDAAVREQIDRYEGECLKFTGDGYLAIFRSCGNALECTRALRKTADDFEIAIRCGVHAGGFEPFGDDAVGLTVTTAARLMSEAGAGVVLVSDTVQTAVAGAGYRFGPVNRLQLKGIPLPVLAAELITTDGAPPIGTWRPPGGGGNESSGSRFVVASVKSFPRLVQALTLLTRPRRFAG